jgi:hypothetical protein
LNVNPGAGVLASEDVDAADARSSVDVEGSMAWHEHSHLARPDRGCDVGGTGAESDLSEVERDLPGSDVVIRSKLGSALWLV